jgi:hypothetical protein
MRVAKGCRAPDKAVDLPMLLKVGPLKPAYGKWVQYEPREVELLAFAGQVRSVHAISIKLIGPNAVNPEVPPIAGPVEDRIEVDLPRRSPILRVIE